ncbi:MAG: hypothetical protein HY791_37920 [Deltaproteobacteria bacterium]|nr:hypothetical protein [Deltaproteobacteria bacterium]
MRRRGGTSVAELARLWIEDALAVEARKMLAESFAEKYELIRERDNEVGRRLERERRA